MDQSNIGPSVDTELSDSWTLLEKEANESGDLTIDDGNESLREGDSETKIETSQSISNSLGSIEDVSPLECPLTTQNEGTESIDSDGISIISESEEEELKLLPCSSTSVEDRPCSRSSNKYFDETDTASQCSSGVQEVMVTQSEKKYKHLPNSNLNTILNVFLVISCAAVVGLGIGHFLGLQEECSTGYVLDDKVKNDTQNEELSAFLLKKLELENIALKEQFAHLQKMIEELHQKNGMSSCKDETLQGSNLISATDNKDNDNVADWDRSECELDPPNMHYNLNEVEQKEPFAVETLDNDLETKCNGGKNYVSERNIQSDVELPEEKNVKNDYSKVEVIEEFNDENLINDETKVTAEDTDMNKNVLLQRLEKSLEDVAVLFNDKLNTNKISFESSKEALSGTISVLSDLLGTLKEKFNGIKESMDGDSFSFDKPFKAITKMEEVLQKTSEKVQKITENAFKEGKPLFTFSNKVTSKLQAINKKLEEKWCQVKRNLSKQSVIWNWLDNQIFQNCTEDDQIASDVDKSNNNQNSNIFQEEPPRDKGIKRPVNEFNSKKEKNGDSYKNGKKAKVDKYDPNYSIKQNGYIKDFNFGSGKTKDMYKRNDYIDPNSFDYKPGKGNGKENMKPSQNKEKPDMNNKKNFNSKEMRNGPVRGYEIGNGKNGGKYDKSMLYNKSGEWVEALFNHRAERRRDERRSDWFFARARSRSKTRDKESQPSRWYLRKGETHAKF